MGHFILETGWRGRLLEMPFSLLLLPSCPKVGCPCPPWLLPLLLCSAQPCCRDPHIPAHRLHFPGRLEEREA